MKKKKNRSFSPPNTFTITLRRHHDELSMKITVYKYKKENYFKMFSKSHNASCTIYFKKDFKVLNYKRT